MEQHRTLTLDDQTIHYRDEGRDNTKTIVLLHGFLQSLDVWSSYVLTYMHRLRVLTIDLPGHGHSSLPAGGVTVETMAKQVKAVLDHAGVDQCVMVGHSMGGYVALAFADLYPYSLRGLGLVASHALPDSLQQQSAREAACRHVVENRASYVVDFIPSLFHESNRSALSQEIKDLCDQCLETHADAIVASQNAMLQRPSRLHVLRNLEVPVLFVHGKGDKRLPIEVVLSQAMEPRHAEILLLDGAAHMPFIEQQEYVKPRICNFVDTCYY